jgi:O-acetyl-ADP-ribose deacetylase
VNEHLDAARLVAVVERATGLPANVTEDGGWVKFLPGQVRAAQRAGLLFDGSHVRLGMWPAELASQYKFVYSNPEKIEGLVALNDQPFWDVNANFHLAYWLSAPAKRWYPTRLLDGPTYMHQWLNDF